MHRAEISKNIPVSGDHGPKNVLCGLGWIRADSAGEFEQSRADMIQNRNKSVRARPKPKYLVQTFNLSGPATDLCFHGTSFMEKLSAKIRKRKKGKEKMYLP